MLQTFSCCLGSHVIIISTIKNASFASEARRDNRDVITEEPNLFGFRAESNPNDSNDMRLSIDVLSSYRNDDGKSFIQETLLWCYFCANFCC